MFTLRKAILAAVSEDLDVIGEVTDTLQAIVDAFNALPNVDLIDTGLC